MPGSIKANFNVAMKRDFAVAATVISDVKGTIIGVATNKFLTKDVTIGEAQAAPFFIWLFIWLPHVVFILCFLKGMPYM